MDQVASAMTHIGTASNHNVESLRQLERAAASLQHVGQTLTSLTKQSVADDVSAWTGHNADAQAPQWKSEAR
jgi:hypothetical protein